MYRVAVVDDQIFIADAISSMIENRSDIFEVSNVFYDGEECLESLKKDIPDIILTDVKMPKMDGIQLAGEVYQKYPSIKLIILSGYEDFSYAQKAISLGVCGYLLKPCSPEELLQSLEKTAEQIQRERNDKDMIHAYQEIVVDNLPSLKQQAIIAMMFSEEKKINPKNLKLDYLMGVNYLYIITPDFLPDEDKEEVELILFCCSNILEELLPGIPVKELFVCNRQLVLIFPCGERSQEKIELDLRRVCNKIEELVHYKIRYFSGGIMDGIMECKECYETALAKWEDSSLEGEINAYHNSNTSGDILQRAKKYIQENYHKDISLQDVSEAMYVSYNYLSSLFTQNSGVSFSTYLSKIRIEKACELLKDPHNRVSDISELVGYQNYRYFNYVFKKLIGYTPSEYRRIRYTRKE